MTEFTPEPVQTPVGYPYLKRPRANVPESRLEKVLEIVSLVILVGVGVVTIALWTRLIDFVPTQMNLFGSVDYFAPKNTMIVIPSVVLVLYVIATVASWYPQYLPYAAKVTEENHIRLYSIGKKSLSVLRMELSLFFAYLNIAGILTATPPYLMHGLGRIYLYVTLFVLVGTVVYFVYREMLEK
jgi:hypothetical protein